MPSLFDEAEALRLDAEDPLRGFREEFLFPAGPDGRPVRYFTGNSLGLMPRGARQAVERDLEAWARYGVDGHFRGPAPWTTCHERVRGPLARLVGARETEVVAMNTLTVNLHLLMVSFFRPEGARRKILIENPVFPSDLYAVKTQLRHHGLDPASDLLQVGPGPGEATLRDADLEEVLDREGDRVALVLLGGVNFLTGQRLDMERIARACRRAGTVLGLDLAHAAGNVELRLHDWDVDFAVWCSYKYLNAGPGAIAGAFVHERHAADTTLPRFGGWWGNDPATRFRMQLEPEFVPVPTADGWQVSNTPVLALSPLAASLELFERAGMEALREKSVRLTGYLERLLREGAADRVEILTPADPAARGCQLSLRIRTGARVVRDRLQERGAVCDFREPDVIRAAPAPLYNSFHDAWALASILAAN